jgi:hypothetical protein
MSCPYTGNNVNLKTACECLDGVKSLNTAMDKYEKDYETHLKNMANYNIEYKKWQNIHDRWSSDKSNEEKRLADDIIYAGCGACGTQRGCPGGYDWKYTEGCGWGNTLCQYRCGRNKDQISIDLKEWLANNPEPKPPLVPTFEKKPPSGINIQCCNQLFSGVKADTVNFSNIAQQCELKIQNDINNISKTEYITQLIQKPQEPEKTSLPIQKSESKGSKVNTGIIISVIIFIIACSSLLAVILFMFSSNGNSGMQLRNSGMQLR